MSEQPGSPNGTPGEDQPQGGSNEDWFDLVPKVELHLHLEGAIPLPALWELVGKYGGRDEVPTLAALRERFRYRDFPHFIDTWIWKNRFLRELDDFTFIAGAVARHLRAQRIRYAEVFYSPPDFARHELGVGDLTVAVRKGLDRVDGIEIRLIADLVRDFGPEQGARTLEAVAEVRDQGVIGVGIGGSEQAHPPAPFAAVYERARALGLRTSAHAGEAAGADSVWSALRDLKVDRIGHGTRAAEDPALLDHLAEIGVPLEMCPISNVRTGVVPDLAAHPIRDYLARGLVVTVNTDDPAMFQTSLAHEYRELCRVHGLTRDQIRALIDSAVQASWLPDQDRAALRARLHAEPAWAA